MFKKDKLSSFEEAALKVLQQEAVHPMGVHVKEVPGKKVDGLPAFKVTKVGSKVKEHGGIKVGEHIHDNHIDDLADMGHKIKTEDVEQVDELNVRTMRSYKDKAEDDLIDKGQDMKSATPAYRKRQQGIARASDKIQTKKIQQRQDFAKRHFGGKVVEDTEQVDEMDMTHSDPAKHAKSKKFHYDLGKKRAMAGKEKGEASDSYGPYASDYEAGYHSVGPNKFKPIKKEENEMDENTPQKTLADYVADHITQDFDRRTGRDTEQVEDETIDEAEKIDGVVVQKIPENPKHTAKMKKAARMYKSIPAAQRGTGSGGKRGADSGFRTVKVGEEVDQVDETIEYHNEYEIQVAEEYTYEDFVRAAIEITDGSDDAIAIAEDCYRNNDISIIIEQFTRGDIQDKISAHKKAGSSVTMPKYTTKDDKMHAEYTVTDKKGMRRRHIHHGNISRVENLGKVNVSPDEKE